MTNILGIDYGTVTIGVAMATTPIAEPLVILDNDPKLLHLIKDICVRHQVAQIVVGLSEGAMAEKTKTFAQELATAVNLPQVFHDETLTSVEAKALLAHAPKSTQAGPQDAYQATVMLQDYLDTHPVGQPIQS